MVIGGLQKFSLSDFPGMISAIVFTRGCNFRCPYCHNPELVDPERFAQPIRQEDVLSFLASRKGQLQGVVVTGGEPTIHADLPSFLDAVRHLGFATKVDTNGCNPKLLEELVERGLVDYLAMDLKAPFSSYARVAGAQVDTRLIEQSLQLIIGSGLSHELRTTYVEPLLSDQDMREIAALAKGCARLFLQAFRPNKTLDPGMLHQSSPSDERLREIRHLMAGAGVQVFLR